MSRIVFGSSNHWTSPYQVGSHAWARLFARHDWEVAYVSDPLTPWHGISSNRDRTRERLALWQDGGASGEDRVMAWVPRSLIAPHSMPFFRSAWVLDSWHRFARPPIVGRLRDRGFDQPEFLWLDSIRHAGWGSDLRPQKTILRIADWTAGFSSTPRSVIEAERKWLVRADLVIASAESLADRLRHFREGRSISVIRNGVDFDFWNTPVPQPPEYEKIPTPRAVYLGALDDWFDHELLLDLAARLDKVSFVIIGRRPDDRRASPSNIHWLGTRPRGEARRYVRHAQVGIIPFRRNALIECVCPLKLYEYMACGLPVVATRWDELERMKSPARLATGPEEWAAQLRSALAGGGSGTESAYASSNDWKSRWREWELACAST